MSEFESRSDTLISSKNRHAWEPLYTFTKNFLFQVLYHISLAETLVLATTHACSVAKNWHVSLDSSVILHLLHVSGLFRLTIIQVPTSVLSTKTGTVFIPYRYNVGNLTNFTITMRLLIQDPGSLVQNLHGGSHCILRTTVKSIFVKSLLQHSFHAIW